MKLLNTIAVGSFIAIVAAIVFVRAGRGGGKSGGEQTAEIIRAAGGTIAETIRSFTNV